MPTGKSSKFKKWVNGIVQPVEKKCGKDLVLVDNNGTSVLDRYTNTTIGNMKIDLFNDSIFSGLFVFQAEDMGGGAGDGAVAHDRVGGGVV